MKSATRRLINHTSFVQSLELSRGKGEFSVLNLSRSRETTQWETEAPSRSLAKEKERLQWPETAIKRFVGRGFGPYLLSCPPPLRCPHFSPARDFIRPQCREIKPFWDIYEWIGHTDDAGPRRATKRDGGHAAPAPSLSPLPSPSFVLRHRARFATCCQTRRRLPVPFRSGSNLLPSLLRSVLLHLLAYFLFSLRYCLWNSSNGAG